MSRSVLYMSMSLDGFIAGPNDGPGNGLGDDGNRLHDWLWAGGSSGPSGVPGRPPGVNGQVFDEVLATGAVVTGRRTFEIANGWAGDQDVMVHGAGLAQSLLREGLLDELEIHLIPVVLGDGRRLFGADHIELELTRVLDAPGVTHLHYRVAS